MKKIFAPWRMEYISREADEHPSKCIFCFPEKEYLVFKNGIFTIVMNKYPYTNGHIMVAPSVHGKNLNELSKRMLTGLFEGVQRAYSAVMRAYKPKGLNIGINAGMCAGAGITDHLHVHIVPRWEGDTNFMPVLSDTKIVSEHIKQSRNRIKKALREVMNG